MADISSRTLDSRREFLKKAALLAASGGMAGTLAASIQKAFAIDPAPGTTYFDAEHVVILMQENRSFDHVYGTLQGVRGFNDPRTVSLPVELAMRYQNPTIESAVKNLAAKGATEVLLIPLFPHYAMSSYETAVVRVQEVVA